MWYPALLPTEAVTPHGEHSASSVSEPYWPLPALPRCNLGVAGLDLYGRTSGSAQGLSRHCLGASQALGAFWQELAAARTARKIFCTPHVPSCHQMQPMVYLFSRCSRPVFRTEM